VHLLTHALENVRTNFVFFLHFSFRVKSSYGTDKLLQIKAETEKDMTTDSAVACSDQRL